LVAKDQGNFPEDADITDTSTTINGEKVKGKLSLSLSDTSNSKTDVTSQIPTELESKGSYSSVVIKLWLNGSLFNITHNGNSAEIPVIVNLKNGNNYFCFVFESSGKKLRTLVIKIKSTTSVTESTVQNSDGTTATTTTATTAKSNIANLTALTVSKGYLQPVFAAATTSYLAAPIPFSDSSTPAYNDTQSVGITATASSGATIKINGTTVTSGTAHTLSNLAVGANSVNIVVTSEDGTVTKTYTVSAYRAIPVFKTGAGTISGYTLDSREDGTVKRGVSWPATRFTDNGDTLTDNMTGLIWQKNANSASGTTTWINALNHVAALTTGGYSDWRLPNAREILSLANYGIDYGATSCISDYGFTSIPVDGSNFWTNTTYTYFTGNSWYYKINHGQLGPDAGKTSSNYVLPVRSNAINIPVTDAGSISEYTLDVREDGSLKKGISLPSIRFRDNGDGTVTDNLTGLIWLKNVNNPNGQKTWADALTYVDDLNAGSATGNCGKNDWRLPNVNELSTIFICSQSHMYEWLAAQGFTNVPTLELNNFWTNTTANPSYGSAWFVRLNYVNVAVENKGTDMFVWPVRGN